MAQFQSIKYLKKNFLTVLLLSLIFICLSFAFSVLVIKDFSNPLDGVGDIGIWEYMGFYFSKNLELLPFPTLNLTNNQVFYPYGTNSVFQGWGIEKDLFYALLYLLFGIGPWLQIYYLLSVATTSIGTFLLLRRDYGLKRAAGAGFLVSFANFYALHKYPAHFDNSVIHWTTLSFITDFLIVKRFTLRQSIPLQLILVRAFVFVLSFGQGLGYIAGFALTSFTASLIFITIIFICRYYKREIKIGDFFKHSLTQKYNHDFKNYPRICCLLISLTIIISYLYFPLVLQLTKEAKSFDFSQVPSGSWWTNPLRLLLPILPNLRPLYGGELSFKIFRDSSEGFLAGSPGFFLLLTGISGLWQARKRILIFIPLIIIFLLFLAYDPGNFPTIRIFPWFAFNRVGGRSTAIYPVILCLFALHFNLGNLPAIQKKVCSVLLVLLACTELYTAYSFKNDYHPYSFVPNFFSYMDYVKKQPGEAVLDFPFCAIGGNGVGAQELCPYFYKNGGVYGLRRFHHKKVMGQAFARLHPFQIQPYLQAGWHKLFFPDNTNFPYAVMQTRCFKPDEWSFITDFYKLNDFAGINLYVDLFPEQCVNEFYERFGNPAIETVVPGAGRVKFLPKSAELRSQVNLTLGTHLKFEPILNFSESNLLGTNSDRSFLDISGLDHQEGVAPNNWRWGLGPETSLKFKLPQTQSLQLSFRFINPIADQDVVVEANGETLIRIKQLKIGEPVDKSFKFKGIKGLNSINFKYKLWNRNKITIAPKDHRPVALQFIRLLIQPE
jgi:hypothetical protein